MEVLDGMAQPVVAQAILFIVAPVTLLVSCAPKAESFLVIFYVIKEFAMPCDGLLARIRLFPMVLMFFRIDMLSLGAAAFSPP